MREREGERVGLEREGGRKERKRKRKKGSYQLFQSHKIFEKEKHYDFE